MVRRLPADSSSEEEAASAPESGGAPKRAGGRHEARRPPHRTDSSPGSDTSIDVSFEELDRPPPPARKLKAKPGRDAASTSAAEQLRSQGGRAGRERSGNTSSMSSASPKQPGRRRRGRERDSGTSSEEERWLDAIKSGKLEEVDDELKKIKPKDPKMMTARQRAMYERSTERPGGPEPGPLLALPSGYKAKVNKVLTAEAIEKAAIKSQKRKQLADEKREKDKKKTMDRLLKKQESRNAKSGLRGKVKKQVPMMLYRSNLQGISLSLPVGVEFPVERRAGAAPPEPVRCSVHRCTNLKKYSCSKTNVPLCSLACYRKNLQAVII